MEKRLILFFGNDTDFSVLGAFGFLVDVPLVPINLLGFDGGCFFLSSVVAFFALIAAIVIFFAIFLAALVAVIFEVLGFSICNSSFSW